MKDNYIAPEANCICFHPNESIAAIGFIDIFDGAKGPGTAATASDTDIHIVIK